ncbi:MAG: RHS repeat-associated core domain-containing protein [Theionarchaea archaeon]|nr:RHS repeat-associated core domain-containing protein [Theionarchaea archaeon]
MYDYDLLLSAGEQTFTYDSNGNTLTKSSEFQWVYHYNNANQLTQVDRDGQTFSHYLYDGDGNRIKKTEMNEDVQDFVTTIYIYSGLDVLYEVNTMGTALYVYGPSGRIAKQTTVNNETNTLYYIQDHLGSTRLVTDSNGTPLTSVEYYPFGRHEYSGSQESYLFTGKEKDATGLSYFGARYYDPETGRFLTRDPYTFLPDDPRILSTSAEDLLQWLLTPQRFNRFSYAGNNPLRYKDPTGLSFTCTDPECQDLLGGEGEDPPPQDTSQDNSDVPEDNPIKSRTEKCRDCTCKDRLDIKALTKLKTDLLLGEISIGLFYALLCGMAGAILCAPTVIGSVPCLAALGIFCGFVMTVLIDVSMDDAINDIHSMMDDLGCSCAIYC